MDATRLSEQSVTNIRVQSYLQLLGQESDMKSNLTRHNLPYGVKQGGVSWLNNVKLTEIVAHFVDDSRIPSLTLRSLLKSSWSEIQQFS
jgi:hypothetical protein